MKEEAQKRREDEKREYKRIRQQEVEERALKKELFQIPEAQEQRKMPREAREEDKKPQKKRKEQTLDFLPVTWAASYLPIRQVKNGIILTSDNRYVKLVEILPINFLLRSPGEQRNIIFSFMSYLKIAPSKIQFKVVSKKADILEYIEKIREEAEKETDERCRLLQELLV